MKNSRKFIFLFLLWFLAVPSALIVSLSIGSTGTYIFDVFSNRTLRELILDVRLPRVLSAFIVGASLASAGSALQGILRNPLAEPFILGVSGGAALGGTAAILLGLTMSGGMPWVIVFAFAASAITTLFLSFANRIRGKTTVISLLLTGVVFNSFSAALITISRSVFPMERTHQLGFWLSGTIGYESNTTLMIVAIPAIVSITALALLGKNLNILALGDSTSQTMGIDPSSTRTAVFLWCSLLTAVSVSLAGLVGFIGLIVPQALRVSISSDQRFLIPASAATGSIFLMLADAFCRFLVGFIGSEFTDHSGP